MDGRTKRRKEGKERKGEKKKKKKRRKGKEVISNQKSSGCLVGCLGGVCLWVRKRKKERRKEEGGVKR
jgi:hypothetical protein